MTTLDGRTEPRRRPRAWATRLTGATGQFGALLRHAPLTVAVTALIWIVGAATGSLRAGPSPPVLRVVGTGPGALAAGQWWTPVSSALWCADITWYLVTTVLLLTLVAPAEHRFGAAKTGLLLLITQIGGTFAGSALVQLGSLAGDEWTEQLAAGVAVGAGPAAVGVGLAMTSRLSTLWRRRLRLLLLLALLLLVAYSGTLPDVLRLAAGLTGLLAGPLLLGRSPRAAPLVASRSERRVLVALVVAATCGRPGRRRPVRHPDWTAVGAALPAAGPATRRLHRATDLRRPGHRRGLSGAARPADRVRRRASDHDSAAGGVAAGHGDGPTPRPPRGMVGGAAAESRVGRHGRAVGHRAVRRSPRTVDRLRRPGQHQTLLAILLPLTLPLLVAAARLATRRSFDVRAPRATYRKMATVSVGTLLLLGSLYLLGGYLLRDQFDQPPTLGQLLLHFPTRFIPPGYLGEVDPPFLPVGAAATVLSEWTGVVFLTACSPWRCCSRSAATRGRPGVATWPAPGPCCRRTAGHRCPT